MVIPVVTEVPLTLQSTTRDDFLGSLTSPAPSGPVGRRPDSRDA